MSVLSRRRRAYDAALIRCLESVALGVLAGQEISRAWEGARGPGVPPLEEGGSCLDPTDSLWFSLLEEIRATGGPVLPCLRAFAETVRHRRERDREAFVRELPRRLSAVLMVCFLPAAFLLLFPPLLAQMGREMGGMNGDFPRNEKVYDSLGESYSGAFGGPRGQSAGEQDGGGGLPVPAPGDHLPVQ